MASIDTPKPPMAPKMPTRSLSEGSGSGSKERKSRTPDFHKRQLHCVRCNAIDFQVEVNELINSYEFTCVHCGMTMCTQNELNGCKRLNVE